MSREVVITGVGRRHRRSESAPARCMSAGAPASSASRTARARRRSSSPPSTSRSRRSAAPIASPQFALVAGDEALAEAGWSRRAALRRRPDRFDPRHRHRRHRHARARQGAPDRGRAEEGPAALRAADDEQRRRRRSLHALQAARPVPRHRLRLLGRARTPSAPPKMMIESGLVDAVVTGGSESALTPLSMAAFARARRAVERRHLAPVRRGAATASSWARAARSWCSRTAEKAAARGAKVLGTLRGYGASADAYHLTAPDKNGGGPSRAMQAALKDAGIDARGHRLRQRARHVDGAQRLARRPRR